MSVNGQDLITYVGHILGLHHVVCSVCDAVEEIGVFISSEAGLSQVDAGEIGWKQICPLCRKVTLKLLV